MTFNVAVVGLGVGEQHARAFAALSQCRVKWLFDLDAEKAERIAVDLGQGTVAASFDDILDDPETAIISLATYDHMHYEDVGKILDAGKHVFVEKPLCRTDEEAADLHRRWSQAGNIHLASNLVLRGASLYGWLRNAVEAGEFGEIYAFDGDYLYGRLEKITEGWRKDVPGYSVMEGGGIHIIDLMLWLTGQTPDQVTTVGTKIATRGTDFAFDDFMASTFTFASGAVGRITANFGCVHPHHHVIRLFGTKATFIYDDQGPRMFRNREDGASAAPLDMAALPDSKGVLIPSFVESISKGDDPTSAANREFDLISVCAAADRAHRFGTSQEIRTMT